MMMMMMKVISNYCPPKIFSHPQSVKSGYVPGIRCVVYADFVKLFYRSILQPFRVLMTLLLLSFYIDFKYILHFTKFTAMTRVVYEERKVAVSQLDLYCTHFRGNNNI